MTVCSISLLGGLEIQPTAKPLIVLPTRKAEALLAVLVRHPGRRHTREKLTAFLWPDSSQAHARTSLRQSLKQLRRSLAPLGTEVIAAEADTLAIQPALVDVDVERFEHAHESGSPEAFKGAVRLYRGEFLNGFAPPSEPCAEWINNERLQLHERAVDVLSKLLFHNPEHYPPEGIIQLAVRLLALDPLQERIHRLLIECYLEQGRRGAALNQYRSCRTMLKQELGIVPDADTELLHQRIRQFDRDRIVVPPPGSDATPHAAIEAVVTRPAVAVLPFANLSDNPARLYFADGLSEDVLTALACWRRFPLIASNSSWIYRNDNADVRQIADDLGAQYLVTGAVRRTGNRARINARLVEADSGHTLWVQRYDVEIGDIFTAQEEIAAKIATAVQPQLEYAELRRIVVKRSDQLDAWDHFLHGISFLKRFTREGNIRAKSHFEYAIQLDPDYSDAYTGLADSRLYDILLQEREAGTVRQPGGQDGSLSQAFEAARRAVALDPDSSAAHRTLGHAYVWAQEFDIAIAETEMAINLNPSNADARRALGNRLDLVGHSEEGIAHMEWALQLNPCDPRRWIQIGFLTRAHLDARHYDEALCWARRAVRLQPDQPDTHFRLAACLAHVCRRFEARAAIAECERLRPGFVVEKASWKPYSDPARNEHFFAGLRTIGVVE